MPILYSASGYPYQTCEQLMYTLTSFKVDFGATSTKNDDGSWTVSDDEISLTFTPAEGLRYLTNTVNGPMTPGLVPGAALYMGTESDRDSYFEGQQAEGWTVTGPDDSGTYVLTFADATVTWYLIPECSS